MSIELLRLEVLSALFCTDQNCRGWKFYGRVVKLQTLEVLRSVFSDHRPLFTELQTLVLNSKAEFNRCKIQRLSLDQKTDEEQMDKARDRGEEQLGDCSARLLRLRDMKDKESRRGIEKVKRTSSMKNKQTEDQTLEERKRGNITCLVKTGG